MSKVINIIDHSPHLSGEAKCVNCGNIWQAVAPTGKFDELQCPCCNTMKGVLTYGVVPDPTWMCDCGCWLFAVSGESGDILCWQCGTAQRFGDE